MAQAKAFIVTGTTGTRNGQKETTLAKEIEFALNRLFESGLDPISVSTITLPNVTDSALVTVVCKGEPVKVSEDKKKK